MDNEICKCGHLKSKHVPDESVPGALMCIGEGSGESLYCECMNFEDDDLKKIEANYDALQSPMPCGHLARYAVNEEAGTQYCVMCVLEATQLTITNLVNDDDPDSETRLYELADKLTNHDNGQECPYCYKTEWGKEKHAADCPFAIAYDVLDKKDGRK